MRLGPEESASGDAGPRGDHASDVVGPDLVGDKWLLLLVISATLGTFPVLEFHELLFELGDVAVEDLRGTAQVAFALGTIGLHAEILELCLELAHLVEAGFLALPAGGELVHLLGARREMLAHARELRKRSRIIRAFEGELFHLESVDLAAKDIELNG